MTTEQQFNCVFCKENFSTKEELQIHFRKHGDPNFDKSTKSKNRALNDSPNSNEKLSEDSEMVGCDVCDEVFPTISKAITHKHKVHPDHDAKYFCPFCGKLFTMKHLYNKHIQTNHDPQLSVEKSEFHCDCCEVMFYVPSAMLYHNKFFHRQDTDIPGIGSSKKIKLCSQEMIQLYYCAFCGEEYNNKVNLHKHIGDDHGDENQSPTDILKCPLCEAMFYHLDAYELHLMFHTTEDVYSEKNEMADEVKEFSLETVPPIAEKIEDEDTRDNNMGDTEGMGMENFLQLLMGESEDNVGKIKNKKHKKHKKSKKAAITLDEFLNMNKDVFGDGLDVQGIEEVPTQVVLKKMTGKKAITNKAKAINADINKLKKIGITVKTKSSNNLKPIVNRCIVNKTVTLPSKVEEKKSNVISAPEELLSKLMRQGNSQIKIVKKSTNHNMAEDGALAHLNTIPATVTEEKGGDDAINDDKSNQIEGISTENDMMLHNGNNNESACNGSNSVNELNNAPVDNEATINKQLIEDEISKNEKDDLNNTEKSSGNISQSVKCHKEGESSNLSSDENNKEDYSSDPDLDSYTSDEMCDDKINLENECSSNETIGALKHLSHLITIKPVKQDKSNQDAAVDYKIQNTAKKDSTNTSSDDSKQSEIPLTRTIIQQSTSLSNKASEALKMLNKNLVVKSISSNAAKSDCQIEKSDDSDNNAHQEVNNSHVKTLSQLKAPSNESPNQSQIAVKDTSKSMSETSLNNITSKQISHKNNQKEINTLSKTINNKSHIKIEKPIENKVVDDEIEIFNIDDSDSDDATNEATEFDKDMTSDKVKESVQLQNVLHNLGSNITIKSTNQKQNEVKNRPSNNETPFQTNINKFKKVNKPSPEIQKSINLQNTLKNLGSHITIKSKNTSSTYSNEEHTTFDNEEAHSDHSDSDTETEVGKVKITEITEETSDLDEDNDDCDTNAIVHSPEGHDSDSEHHSFEEDSDIESKIKANSVKKCDRQIPKASFSDNIKCLNKDLVIKPINDKKINSENVSNISYEKKSCIPSNNNSKTASQASASSSQINTLNRKINTSANEVNTVKTVKKFQTETVIQEITTVTRTIRTVNESTNETVQTGNQSCVLPQKVNRNQPGIEHQGKIVRHISPTVGTKVRNPGNIRPANPNSVRTPNQIVPIRTIANPIQHNQALRKPLAPGMQIARKTAPPMSSPQKLVTNKLKMSPNVITQTTMKRPSENISNIVSSMKKPKESTISLPTPKSNDSMEQYTASTSRSEFSSVTKIVKGKSSMSATQTRSEVNTCTQQQLNRLSNMSGLKIMKTSTKQAVEVEEKNEVSASKRNTLEAIEKLQKQGLLVKKPRVEFNDSNEHDYFSESDEDSYEQ